MSHLTYPDGLPIVECHLNPAKPYTLAGEGLRVILDPTQCIPNDPGAGCPVIVSVRFCDHDGTDEVVSATWLWCIAERAVDHYKLTPRQMAWLDRIADDVESWLHGAWTLANGGAK